MGRGGPNEMTEFLGWLDLNRSDGQIGFTHRFYDIENVTSLMYRSYNPTAVQHRRDRTTGNRIPATVKLSNLGSPAPADLNARPSLPKHLSHGRPGVRFLGPALRPLPRPEVPRAHSVDFCLALDGITDRHGKVALRSVDKRQNVARFAVAGSAAGTVQV